MPRLLPTAKPDLAKRTPLRAIDCVGYISERGLSEAGGAWACSQLTTHFRVQKGQSDLFGENYGVAILPMVVLAVLLIYFGIYPSPLLNLIRTTMAGISVATQMGPQ